MTDGRSLAFRGWVTVGVAAVMMVATLPGRTHGLGLVTESLLAKFPDLDKIKYAEMNLWATLAGALFCFPAGWCIDRFGLRTVTALVAGALGLTTIGMTYTETTDSLGWLFMLSRGFGQSALSVASIALLARAFPAKSNAAAAVFTLLVGILFGAAFKVMGSVVGSHPWTVAWGGLGWTVLLLGPALAFAARPFDVKPRSEGDAAETGFTLGQALRTGAFWAFAVGVSLYGLVSSGMGLFMQSILDERGFVPAIEDAKEKAAASAKLVGDLQAQAAIYGMSGQLLSGFLLQAVSYRVLFCAALAVYAAALAFFPFITTQPQLNAYVAAIGVAGGTLTLVFFGAWKSLFGSKHVGRIIGAAQMGTVAASAVGALYFATLKNRLGNYTAAIWLVAGAALAVAIWAAFLKMPSSNPEPSHARNVG